MEADLVEALDRLSACRDVILFSDLQGGSCSLICRSLLQKNEHLAVVTGFNLPMLIEFIFYRDRPFVELLSILKRKGKDGIRVFGPSDA
jgi:mannose/fructose-specific phosphotransferase system component IIA